MKRFLAVALFLAVASIAEAFTGTGNVQCKGGACSFTGTLPIASGGTNNASLSVTQGTIYYGDGTKLVGLAPGTSGQCLKTQGAAANPIFANCATTDTNTIPIEGFGSGMDVDQNSTVYIWPGFIDVTKAKSAAPLDKAATFENMNCQSSAAPGGSDTFTVILGVGTCGSESFSTKLQCQISASGTTCDSGTSITTVAAGECVVARLQTSATAATATVSCTMERTT